MACLQRVAKLILTGKYGLRPASVEVSSEVIMLRCAQREREREPVEVWIVSAERLQ